MRTHRTDWLSLIFALIFLAVAAWWLLAQLVHLALPQVGWIVAVALIAIGTLGLVGALRSNRDLTQPAGTSPAQATETRPPTAATSASQVETTQTPAAWAEAARTPAPQPAPEAARPPEPDPTANPADDASGSRTDGEHGGPATGEQPR